MLHQPSYEGKTVVHKGRTYTFHEYPAPRGRPAFVSLVAPDGHHVVTAHDHLSHWSVWDSKFKASFSFDTKREAMDKLVSML